MSNRDALEEKILEKEKQLSMAEGESHAWNNGKYKNTSNAKMSKILVDSLKKEISSLRQELSETNENGT